MFGSFYTLFSVKHATRVVERGKMIKNYLEHRSPLLNWALRHNLENVTAHLRADMLEALDFLKEDREI